MNLNLKSKTALSSLNLIYTGKVVQERAPFRGVSHLAEHLMSYGVRELEPKYEKYGIVSNAGTSALYVSFYLQGLDRYLHRFGHEFLDKVTTFIPSEELFERERKVVLEEYKDCFTDQISCYVLNQSRRLYDYCGPIGYREDLEQLTYQQYLEFQREFFARPDKLIYVGRRPFEHPLEMGTVDSYRDFPLLEKTTLKLEEGNIFQEKAVAHLHAPLEAGELPYAKFAGALLSRGMDSPLFRMVREKHALAYFVHFGASSLSNNYAVADILTQVSNENLGKAFEVIDHVLAHPAEYISKKRYNDLVFSYKIALEKEEIERYINIGRYLTPYEQTLDYLFDHKLLSYDRMIAFLSNLAPRFRHFSDKNDLLK